MTRGLKPGPPFPGALAISLIVLVFTFLVFAFFAARPTKTTERYQDQGGYHQPYQGVSRGWLDETDPERRR